MTEFTAHEYLTYIETPGRGWGAGCTVERIKDTVVNGVEFVRGTAVDNHTGERTSVYVTDDGYVVEPAFGGYGDSTRWSIESRHDGIRRLQRDKHRMVGTGVAFASNLTGAAQTIREAREHTPDAEPRPL